MQQYQCSCFFILFFTEWKTIMSNGNARVAWQGSWKTTHESEFFHYVRCVVTHEVSSSSAEPIYESEPLQYTCRTIPLPIEVSPPVGVYGSYVLHYLLLGPRENLVRRLPRVGSQLLLATRAPNEGHVGTHHFP